MHQRKPMNEYEDLLKMDGYDDCIVGVVERFGQDSHFIYDKELVLEKLQKDDMSYEDALEYYEFNQLGAYVGEATPAFLIRDYEL
jgi:hypothetical protein